VKQLYRAQDYLSEIKNEATYYFQLKLKISSLFLFAGLLFFAVSFVFFGGEGLIIKIPGFICILIAIINVCLNIARMISHKNASASTYIGIRDDGKLEMSSLKNGRLSRFIIKTEKIKTVEKINSGLLTVWRFYDEENNFCGYFYPGIFPAGAKSSIHSFLKKHTGGFKVIKRNDKSFAKVSLFSWENIFLNAPEIEEDTDET